MIQVEIRIKSAETQESPVIEYGSCGCARVVVLIPYNGASYCRDVQFYALYGKINQNCGDSFFTRETESCKEDFLSSFAAVLSNAVFPRLK
jgi:hypothetical protein